MQGKTRASVCLAGALVPILVSGCWYFTLRPVQAPYITAEPPCTAILQFPYRQNERVLDVTVRQEHGPRYEHTYRFSTCWRIEATHPVSAVGFQVQIGHVPQGFTQVVPAEGERFAAVPGNRYVLKITTTNRRAEYCTWWTPRGW